MKHVLRIAVLCLTLVCLALVGTAAGAGFTLKDTKGDHLDVLLDGKVVGRYMYVYDGSTAERLHETYKPYLHVLDPETGKPITKGAGGLYSHHRAIFGGWKIKTAGKTYDFWHIVRDLANAKKVVGKPHFLMLHRKFLETEAAPDRATVTALIDWADPQGKTLVEERRTMTFIKRPAPAIVEVGFTTHLKAVAADTNFGGDPEHAGVQYRPADEVDRKKTKYLFHAQGIDLRKDKDLPWVAEQYVLDGKTYSVLAMNHATNPKGTVWSAYRDYGRFGAYPTFDVKKGETQTLRYSFLVRHGELPSRDALQEAYDAFAKSAK